MKPAKYRILLRTRIKDYIKNFSDDEQQELWSIINEYEDDLEDLCLNKNLEFILEILKIIKH